MVNMKKLCTAGMIILLLFTSAVLFGSDSSASEMLAQGKEQFGEGNYQDALLTFRDVVLNPSWEDAHGSAYYWIARSYMALDKAEKALENLNFFLENYPGHDQYPVGLYQKGRMLIEEGKQQEAIKLLYSFTDTYTEHPFRGNAFFWIGEALFSMGHFDESRRLFSTVVNDYPRSYKSEAARYRLSLIDLKKRERELLKLLRISHEEYLKALEQFRRREKEYEYAISSYQRKLAAAMSEDEETLAAELNRESEEQRKELQKLRRENKELKQQVSRLQNGTGEVPVEKAQPSDVGDEELLQRLLELKNEALNLKNKYLGEKRKRGGDS